MWKKKKKRVSRPIVVGHLEKISSGIFEDYPQQVTGLIGHGQGVYALYRREKLYYVGLASDLRRRIKWHLKDKHSGKWDRFSLYIIRKTDYIREVEALLLRIAEPKGSRVRGKLGRSKNLERELQRAVKQKQEEERKRIFGGRKGKVRRKKAKKRRVKTKVKKAERPLRGVFPGGKVIYAKYKGKEYKAWVRTNGGIRFEGQLYDSPSGVGKAIRKKETDGWRFWKYKDASRDLIALKNLRK